MTDLEKYLAKLKRNTSIIVVLMLILVIINGLNIYLFLFTDTEGIFKTEPKNITTQKDLPNFSTLKKQDTIKDSYKEKEQPTKPSIKKSPTVAQEVVKSTYVAPKKVEKPAPKPVYTEIKKDKGVPVAEYIYRINENGVKEYRKEGARIWSELKPNCITPLICNLGGQ